MRHINLLVFQLQQVISLFNIMAAICTEISDIYLNLKIKQANMCGDGLKQHCAHSKNPVFTPFLCVCAQRFNNQIFLLAALKLYLKY